MEKTLRKQIQKPLRALIIAHTAAKHGVTREYTRMVDLNDGILSEKAIELRKDMRKMEARILELLK